MSVQFPELPRRRWTADEVLRLVEQGFFGEDEPIELLNGELCIVSPQGPGHAARVAKILRMMIFAYGEGHAVRAHSPIAAGDASLPEPDVAVVRGVDDDYETRLPSGDEVCLAIEVAYSSRANDRAKAAVYAAAGVAHYWLVDVPSRRVELYTGLTSDGEYGLTRLLGEDEELELPELGRAIVVRELLP